MSVSEMIVGQVAAELDAVKVLYNERGPRKVLEIGVYYGGTLRAWLTHAAPDATIVAVDPDHKNPDLYENWRHEDTTLVVLNGRSSEVADEIRAHAPYDWVFIDGDHSEAGVRFDIGLTVPLVKKGGLLLIHDIIPTTIAPRTCFDELWRDHEGWEIICDRPDDYPENCGHGIGVIRL